MRIKLATLRKLIREELSRSLVTEGVLSPEYVLNPNAPADGVIQYQAEFFKKFEAKFIPVLEGAVRAAVGPDMAPFTSVVGKGKGPFISVDKNKFMATLNEFLNPDGSLKPGAPEGLDVFVEPYVKRDVAAQAAAWKEFYASLVPQVEKVLAGIGFNASGDGRWSAVIPAAGGDDVTFEVWVSSSVNGITIAAERLSHASANLAYRGRAAGGMKTYGT